MRCLHCGMWLHWWDINHGCLPLTATRDVQWFSTTTAAPPPCDHCWCMDAPERPNPPHKRCCNCLLYRRVEEDGS